MYHDVIDQAAIKMEKTKEVYKQELASLRAGRANPKLLDRITVDYYGAQTPLNQMANISSPEPRILMISVWDQKAIPLVEKAIQKSDLGMNPANDGKVIRLVVPELTEERRKELTKLVWKSAEESKVAIRSIRRDAMEQFKKLQKNGEISEDDQYRAEDEMQKTTDSAIKDIDQIAQEKEKEILSV
ncbi:MAG: ribosome recycling factor [Christensenellales bacterium]|jgi:ribosome recycling factor